MNDTAVVLTLKKGQKTCNIEGARVTFSPHQCIAFDNGLDDIACMSALGKHLKLLPGLTLLGSKRFVDYLLKYNPELEGAIIGVVLNDSKGGDEQHGLASVQFGALPVDTKTVFLCDTLTFPCMEMRKQIPDSIDIVDTSILVEISPEIIPSRAWTPVQRNIYPIDIPEIQFNEGLDLAIVDCPSRNLSLMPNGLGYLNNALKKTDVSYQIVDLDIISYHRYHVHRIFDMGGSLTLPGDLLLPEDPWQAEHYDLWTAGGGGASGVTERNEVLEFFRPVIDEAIAALVKARPKVLGLSIQGCNEAAAKEIAVGVKALLPEIIIVVGGFSCYNPDIGRRAFPECDYMCIGEADLTVGPLMEALARGERPIDQPGIVSRFDSPEFPYIPAPMIHDLDTIEFPKYEWCDLSIYRNFNDYQLTPIIASRGCRWSRCTFCAERFYWRIRTPENFVDELEWLVEQGCYLYMFNESDLGGMPERVMEICDEIIRRGLHNKVKLTGQLRVNKKQTRAFYQKLRDANFVALRFGIDAFSENTLRLQKKGYTVDMISQNLKDCWEVGIFTEINWVIGVPGETDEDVTEGIELILKNQEYIGRLANVNPLILVNGSVYWIDPAAHNIVFAESQEEIYKKYPRALPADQWHSTKPYIDAHVRKERFERIVISLDDAGFEVGAWAQRIIDDVKYSRDRARTGGPDKDSKEGFGEFEVAGGKDRETAEPLSEEKSESKRTDNVIQVTQPNDEAKPLAEPPLFGIAGASPKLVRELDTHRIVTYDGWYYGIPHAVTDIDLAKAGSSSMSGIIKFTDESSVVDAIEEGKRWANSRGQYDDQKKQREAGSYMRANSIGVVEEKGILPTKLRIFKFGQYHVAVEPKFLDDAFTAKAVKIKGTAKIEERTFLRRMVSKLPSSTVYKIRNLIKQQSLMESDSGGSLVSLRDIKLIKIFIKAAISKFIFRKGVNHVESLEMSSTKSAYNVEIPGENFSIISVTTKNAQPELMCSVGNYNVVKFDGVFYGLPHGTSIDWESGEISLVDGVITNDRLKEVVSKIDISNENQEQKNIAVDSHKSESIDEFTKTPTILTTMENEGYNIVAYEGWVYGMPHALGNIDLTEVDVMQMPGVIRDVSRDAVETEILELCAIKGIGLSA